MPPSRSDHVLAHPGTFAAALAWIVYGALLLLPSLTAYEWEPSPTLSLLPQPLAIAAGIMLIAGGVGTAWSTSSQHNRLDRVWEVARVSLILAISGWLVHIIAVLWITPHAVVSWSMGITHVLIGVLSLVALSRAERNIREEMRDQGLEA